MTAMDYTDAEIADAGRDAVALVRAAADDRRQDMSAILDAAGALGTRCAAETLADLAADLLVRLTAAHSVAPLEMQELVAKSDIGEFLAEPEIRAAVEANIARIQAGFLSGDSN